MQGRHENLRWSTSQSRVRSTLLSELWGYRELVYAFMIRDLQVRYRQTAIGVAWVVVQPVTHMLLFSGFFQLLGQRPTSGTVPYPLLILSGAIVWQPFLQGIQQATLSLANNRQLITRTYFPRLILPLAAVLTPLIDFLIGWFVLILVGLFFGVIPQPLALLTPLLVIPLTVVTFSLAIWTSMLNAFYRDVMSLVSFGLQAGFFFSPVIVETQKMVPAAYRPLAALNPMVTLIDAFRAAWFGQLAPTWSMVLVSVLSTTLVLLSGLWFFCRNEDIVADRV